MSTATLVEPISAPQITWPTARRQRVAVTALFAISGGVFGSWAARIPDVADRIGATTATLGVALFCISLGSLVGMRATGALCARFGAGPVSAWGAGAISTLLVLPGLAGNLIELCFALTVFGMVTGAVNVAANSLGVELGQRLQKPVMSSLHAGFSFGGLAGALLAGLVSGFLSVPAHFALVAALGLIVSLAIAPTLNASDRPALRTAQGDAAGQRRRPIPKRALVVLLGLIAGCTAFGEGSLSDWGALHLRENLHAGSTMAAAGYAGFSLAMAFGRLTGSRWIMRFGDTTVLVSGTVLAAAGMTLALTTDVVPLAIAGFVLVGLGLANVFPLAITRAGLISGARGIALASMVGYTGLLGGPPMIGFVAGAAGLPVALSSVSVLCLVAGGLSLAVGLEMATAVSVASAMRAQAKARIEPVARRHGTDLLLLLDGNR